MVKRIAIAACLIAGCVQSPKYVEGTSISLGAYVPWGGNLYGVELMNYVSGTVVQVPTNMPYQIERSHTATNSWGWGLLETTEHTQTKIQFD